MVRRQLELTEEQKMLLLQENMLQESDEEVFEKFVRSKRLIGVKDTTVAIYRTIKRVIDRDIALLELDTEMQLLTTENMEQLILYWQRTGIAPATINHRFRVLRPYFKFLKERGYRKTNIMSGIKNVREKQEIKGTLEKHEIKAIAHWFKKAGSFAGFRNLVHFQLLLDTGIRLSESLNIKLQDIKGDTIYIVEPKGLKQRLVFISKQMRKTLDIYLEIRGELDCPYLLVTIDGGKVAPRTFQDALKEAIVACNINKSISPHSLRRTYAKFAVMAGIDPFSLATLLGHSSLEITTRYVQIWGQDLRAQAEKRGNFSGLF